MIEINYFCVPYNNYDQMLKFFIKQAQNLFDKD